MFNEELPAVFQQYWQANEFQAPTAIQAAVYGPLSRKESVVAISPTGSGKTIAYLLPILASLEAGAGNQCLILATSQELAKQVADVAVEWASKVSIQVQSVIGGANANRQVEKLKNKPELIIGTPGRVLELIRAKKINAFQVQSLILDEADQLINQDQQGLVKEIMKAVGKKTMVSFFSATADAALAPIQALVPEIQVIDVTKTDTSQGEVTHCFMHVSPRKTVETLRRLAHTPAFQGLIFFNQLADLGSTEEKLQYHQLKVASLASDQSKELRKMGLNLFKKRELQLLLATDIAARGIDIERLPYVVNAEVPLTKENYLHRAGRVGRMGTAGTVITFVNEYTRKDYQRLMKQLEFSTIEVFVYNGQVQSEPPIIREKAEKPVKAQAKQPNPKSVQPTPTVTTKREHTAEAPVAKKKGKKKQRTKNQKDKGKRKQKE